MCVEGDKKNNRTGQISKSVKEGLYLPQSLCFQTFKELIICRLRSRPERMKLLFFPDVSSTLLLMGNTNEAMAQPTHVQGRGAHPHDQW